MKHIMQFFKKVTFSQVKAHLLIYLIKKEISTQDIILNTGHILKAKYINGFINNLVALFFNISSCWFIF